MQHADLRRAARTREKAAVVTGVSSGIGRAIAASLLGDGWRVFGSVRKAADGEAARAALGDGFQPLVFDVTDDATVADAARIVEAALDGRPLLGLVNNAGVAVYGPAQHIPIADYEFQFAVNVLGPVRVAQAFLPLLGARRGHTGPAGKIVNISSMAGKIATPFMSPYAMSKHALEAWSASLRRELMAYGVVVVVVGPGSIKTPIWDKADAVDLSRYGETDYAPQLALLKKNLVTVGEQGLPPEAVGDIVRDVLAGRARKTRYAVLRNKLLYWVLPRLLPTRMLDRALAERNGVLKRD